MNQHFDNETFNQPFKSSFSFFVGVLKLLDGV